MSLKVTLEIVYLNRELCAYAKKLLLIKEPSKWGCDLVVENVKIAAQSTLEEQVLKKYRVSVGANNLDELRRCRCLRLNKV